MDHAAPVADDPASINPTRAMRQSLSALLDQVRGAREVLRPLAALEELLRSRGLQGIDRIATPALAKVCAQLEGLPARPDDAPLGALKALLGAALDQRRRLVFARPGLLPTLDDPGRVTVEEASLSDYMAAGGAEFHAR